jgi:hypothetical protein
MRPSGDCYLSPLTTKLQLKLSSLLVCNSEDLHDIGYDLPILEIKVEYNEEIPSQTKTLQGNKFPLKNMLGILFFSPLILSEKVLGYL